MRLYNRLVENAIRQAFGKFYPDKYDYHILSIAGQRKHVNEPTYTEGVQ